MRKLSHKRSLVNSLFSFDRDMTVEKPHIQTLACQLSSPFIQLLFPFDQDVRVGKTLIHVSRTQNVNGYDPKCQKPYV